MKVIPLTRGKEAIVDDADYEWAIRRKWHAAATNYAVRRGPKINGTQACIALHREILGAKPGQVVDHINGNRAALTFFGKFAKLNFKRGDGNADLQD